MKLEIESNTLMITSGELSVLGEHLGLETSALSPLNIKHEEGADLVAAFTEYEKLNQEGRKMISNALSVLANPTRKLDFYYTTSERNMGKLTIYWPPATFGREDDYQLTVLADTGNHLIINQRSEDSIKYLIRQVLAVDTNLSALNFSMNCSAQAALALLCLADCYRSAWHKSMLCHDLPESSYTFEEISSRLNDRATDFRWPLQFFKKVLPFDLPAPLNEEDLILGLQELEKLEMINVDREDEQNQHLYLYTLSVEGELLSEGLLNNAGKVALTMTVVNRKRQLGHEVVLMVRDPFYLWLVNLSGSIAAVAAIDNQDLAGLIDALFKLEAQEINETTSGSEKQGNETLPPPLTKTAQAEPLKHQTVTLPTAFLKLQDSYASLKKDLDQGVISADSFAKAIEMLRLQDEKGNWWQLCEDGLSWLKWDGTSWVPDEPKHKD